MAMILDKVVPFGRSMDEYIKIFNLTNADLNKNIIGIGDGLASFNAEMTWEICGGGYGIHWEEIDEDLSTEGMLRGAPAPRTKVVS